MKKFLLALCLSIAAFCASAATCLPVKGFLEAGQNPLYDGGHVHFGQDATHEWAYYLCFPRRLGSDPVQVVYVVAPLNTVSASTKAAVFKTLTNNTDQNSSASLYWARYVTGSVTPAARAAVKADVQATSGYAMQ